MTNTVEDLISYTIPDENKPTIHIGITSPNKKYDSSEDF
jgi:hypothetical protein